LSLARTIANFDVRQFFQGLPEESERVKGTQFIPKSSDNVKAVYEI
jgi:hypothetical protein